MDDFLTERKERNPLRKKELEGQPTNKEWVEQEKKNLPKQEHQRLEAEYLRPKVEDQKLIFNERGIKVYSDKYCTETFEKGSYNEKMLRNIIKKLFYFNKDIIPNRKPKIVITNTKENPATKNAHWGGSPPGAYYNRIIYLDQYHVDDYDVLLHEYAHFLTGRIPRQVEPLLQKEYRKMLQEMFGPYTKRKNLEGSKYDKVREDVAKKMGLPTEYSAANFDEWFAELITHWKNMPNNKQTYRFKQILKKVLNRI